MSPGDRVEVVAAPRWAFGAGAEPHVPADATVVFELERGAGVPTSSRVIAPAFRGDDRPAKSRRRRGPGPGYSASP